MGDRQSCLNLFGKHAWHLQLLSCGAQQAGRVSREPLMEDRTLLGLLSARNLPLHACNPVAMK